ncbi:MAG: sigma-70 family RNA polymerase sigma factor [Vicingaceae bacterium]|nr:sigma-70 family RNA polymerase sigma factor [Vicingaceae bacterium]
MSKSYTDKEIIESIRKGKTERVLSYLYDTAQYKIRKWILKNNGSEEEAQDIFQDAVLSFYNYVLENRFDEGKSVQGFLFAIGKNAWVNRAKQKNRLITGEKEMEKMDSVPDDVALISQSMDDDNTKKIEALLDKLGERCKQMLTYSIFYDMRMDEIAETMGFANANAAKTKNYKCKQRLIGIIKENPNYNIKAWIYN